MMWRRSSGIPQRCARYATSCAEARYSASVIGRRRPIQPSCSIPIERRFMSRFPECQAMSDVLTSWTISPRSETT